MDIQIDQTKATRIASLSEIAQLVVNTTNVHTLLEILVDKLQ